MSRLENSTKNIAFSFGNTVLSSVLGFVSRTVFIYCLGETYLGLSGLLGNVLGFLTISELGIASAIGFSLYKPLAEHDFRSVSALMSIYRKAYSIIGVIVAISGIGLYFALDFFVPPDQQPYGTSVAYFVFLATTVLGYFLSYKTTLISSDNHAYQLVPINIAFNTIQTVLQVVILLLSKSYILYLFIQILCSAALMVAQNRFITRKYKEVDFYSSEKLAPEQKNTIKKNIGGLVIAKIGDYLVNSTDNLIITKLVSLSATGIYSNYLLIRNMVNGIIATFFTGITASMGNVVAVENNERKLEIFETTMFCAYFIYCFEAVCFMCLFNPFIGEIWIGSQFTFDTFTVAIIVINNFLTGLRIPLITMKGAAGTYMEDAWIPFGFAGINLVASIVLAKFMGVAGVFLGTIIGSLLTADWYRPIIIYKKVFHASVSKYYRKYLQYIVLGFFCIAVAHWLCSLIHTPYVLCTFILKSIVACVFPLAVNTILFIRTKEFKAIQIMAKRLCSFVCRKNNHDLK
ncbi:MAG: lipopolysaccharide biosynthesis protein [Faecousia sp.]